VSCLLLPTSIYHYSTNICRTSIRSPGSILLLFQHSPRSIQAIQGGSLTDIMSPKYYESSSSSRSSNEKVYYEPRRGMFALQLSSNDGGMVTNLKSAERKDVPVRTPAPKKRVVEIHHHHTSSDEPRRPEKTDPERWR